MDIIFFSIGKIGKCRNNRINQADDQAQVKFIFSLEIFISRTLKRWAGTADHIQKKWSFIQYKISSANMHTKKYCRNHLLTTLVQLYSAPISFK